MKLQAARYDDVNALRRFLPVAVGVMLGVPQVLFARVTAAGWSGTYQELNVPYEEFPWNLSFVVAQDRYHAGNLRLHFPQSPSCSFGASTTTVAGSPADPLHLAAREVE